MAEMLLRIPPPASSLRLRLRVLAHERIAPGRRRYLPHLRYASASAYSRTSASPLRAVATSRILAPPPSRIAHPASSLAPPKSSASLRILRMRAAPQGVQRLPPLPPRIRALNDEIHGKFERAVILWTLDPAERDAVLVNEEAKKWHPGSRAKMSLGHLRRHRRSLRCLHRRLIIGPGVLGRIVADKWKQISLGFARGKRYHKEPTNDELFIILYGWILLDHSGQRGEKVFILDPRPVNEKYKDYPVGPYTRKIVCISENLIRGMIRCGWAEDIATWVPVFPDIPHEHETQSGYLVYLFMRSWSNGELRLPTYKGCGDLRKQFVTHLLTSPGNDSELSTPDGLNNIALSLYGV
uniref:Uncharacterized protein n=1 Tax=Leersia perrieri TaxID=77586 RepID=A0A0D9WWB7_9ORYZ